MAKVTNNEVYLVEQSSAGADTGNEGQLWVRDDSPNKVMFTDGDGNDSCLIMDYGVVIDTSTGATEYDITDIPTNVKKIIVTFNGISASNNSDESAIRLGTSSGFITTGYESVACQNQSTANALTAEADYFVLMSNQSNATQINGFVTFVLSDPSNNTWVMNGVTNDGGNNTSVCAGRLVLTDELTSLQLTTRGSATYDNGSFLVIYEY